MNMADTKVAGGFSTCDISAGTKDVEKALVSVRIEEGALLPRGVRYLHIDEAVQKRVVRKLDWNIMPILIALCM